ncbi:hypothetical protein [Hyphomicrobium sp. ghe19]|uniref:hypothetical protein n=1 Tax=Hyphomicrobium sp. ghe19 TaxID=2682968 RepID=UPI001366BBCF|nr:hypothetical protein HYPP_03810 [Hyphomicrobium sp. ghe19]
MADTVQQLPTCGFGRGSIVRAADGPNMLVVRDLGDTVCVVRCEGDDAGTLRMKEVMKAGLRQVVSHDGITTEDARIRNALWQFENPPEPATLREAADEIDCGQDCERGHVEPDTGVHVCSRRDREGCPGDLACHLREFASAIEGRTASKAGKA